MSRIYKVSLLILVVALTLACSLISNPINNVKNTANTAQAFATDVSSLTTAFPIETLGALPTQFSQFGDYFNPQGTPLSEWNGIPIMPQEIAGQEFDASNYSFRYSGTAQDAIDFYADSLGNGGWSPMVTTTDAQGALLVYQKDEKFLTMTVTPVENDFVVWMSLT